MAGAGAGRTARNACGNDRRRVGGRGAAAWEEGGVRVALTFATIGPAPAAAAGRSRSEFHLWIGVSMTNGSPRAVEFAGWNTAALSGPVLTAGDGAAVNGRSAKPAPTTLAPGKSSNTNSNGRTAPPSGCENETHPTVSPPPLSRTDSLRGGPHGRSPLGDGVARPQRLRYGPVTRFESQSTSIAEWDPPPACGTLGLRTATHSSVRP